MHCKVCYYYSSGGKNSNLERKFHYFTIGKGSCAKQYGIKCDFKCDYLAASIAIYKGRNEWIKITEKKTKKKMCNWLIDLLSYRNLFIQMTSNFQFHLLV